MPLCYWLICALCLFYPLPVDAGGAVYHVIKVEKVINPEDVDREPLSYYAVNAGKTQGIKAGDVFKITRLVRQGINRDYFIYIADVQAIASYPQLSLTRVTHLADPKIFPLAQLPSVMLGDRAELLPPPPMKVSTKEKEVETPSAPLATSPPVATLPEKKGGKKVPARGIKEKVFFDRGKASLNKEAGEVLKKVAGEIRGSEGKILVVGHTCDLGSDAYNLLLSLKRAQTVMDYLAHHEQVPENRLDVQGLGKKFPAALGKTEKDRALNRRVEFKFLKK